MPGSDSPRNRPTNSQLTQKWEALIYRRMIDEDFLPRVEQFLDKHGLAPTTFGIWAMDDSRFVFDLRAGRQCFGKTIRRVYAFMERYEQKLEAKRLRSLVDK